MQALTKVWNDNDYPHTEQYKGQTIQIPPHSFIEMDGDEAEQFRGQYTPRVKRGDDTDDPRFFKKIRLEHPESRAHRFNPLTSPVTGKVHESEASLKAELEHFKHLHVKEENEKSASEMSKLLDENKKLHAEINEIREMVQSLKPAGKRRSRRSEETDNGVDDAGDTDT